MEFNFLLEFKSLWRQIKFHFNFVITTAEKHLDSSNFLLLYKGKTMQEVDFLRFLIENIVEHTDDIKIEKKDDELWTLLTLQVHNDDMGVVIGKKWVTVNALRSILRLQWMKLGRKITLKVLEQE